MPTYDEEWSDEWTEVSFDAPASVAAYLAGTERSAKQSTRYLARGQSVTDCKTDLSQLATNLIAGTSVVYEASSARFNYSHPRTILLRLTATSTDTGTLFTHGTAGSTESLSFNAANSIRAITSNTTRLTYSVAGLASAPKDMVVAWVSEENPDTTGASDAVQSWLLVWNLTDATFDRTRFTHPVKSVQTTTAFWGASSTVGASAFSGTITGLLYENRAMSATEIAADWVLPYLPAATTVESTDQGLPVAESSGMGDEGQFHGPAAQWAVDATRRMYRRCSSPLANEVLRVRPTWQSTTLTGPFWRGIPQATTYRTHLGWLRSYPVPETCTHVWVRAHVRSWVTSGPAVPLAVRIYTANKRPGGLGLGGGGGGPAEPYVPYYGGEVITRDDAMSVGDWVVEDVVPISRSESGRTYVMVAFRIDPDGTSTNDANARFTISALHVVPCFRDPVGGLQFGEMP